MDGAIKMEFEKKFLVCWFDSLPGAGYILANCRRDSLEDATKEFERRENSYLQNIGKLAWTYPYCPRPEFIVEAWVPKDLE